MIVLYGFMFWNDVFMNNSTAASFERGRQTGYEQGLHANLDSVIHLRVSYPTKAIEYINFDKSFKIDTPTNFRNIPVDTDETKE